MTLPKSSRVYSGSVNRELTKLGCRNPPVRTDAVVRAGLDGNGTQEVLIEAFNTGLGRFYPDGPSTKGGQRSVLLRYVKDGQVHTNVLAKDLQVRRRAQAEKEAPGDRITTRFGLAGVLDASGDGSIEVVLTAAYRKGFPGRLLDFTPGRDDRSGASAGFPDRLIAVPAPARLPLPQGRTLLETRR